MVIPAERLERLRELATTLRDEYKLAGRWRWFGTPDRPHLATRGGGRQVVLDTSLEHAHHRSWPEASEFEADVFPCDLGNDCLWLRATLETPYETAREIPPWSEGEEGAEPQECEYFAEPQAVLRFPDRSSGPFMATSKEIPVFEVCPEATSADDPRVYRRDVRGFRSPVAEWFAELDAETVLELLELALIRQADTSTQQVQEEEAEAK